MSGAPRQAEAVIVFDGVCNLCNGAVDFVIRRDKTGIFRFTANQGAMGRSLLARYGFEGQGDRTILLIEGGMAYTRSEAALRVLGHLGWPWKAMGIFRVVPRPLRDWVYKQIARNRYRLFGKRETCRLPTPEERSRFL